MRIFVPKRGKVERFELPNSNSISAQSLDRDLSSVNWFPFLSRLLSAASAKSSERFTRVARYHRATCDSELSLSERP